MSVKKRIRGNRLTLWVSDEELAQIKTKMALSGTGNLSAFIRHMAMYGYILKLDLPELRELVSLLRRYSNNLNQIARRVNETSRFYDTDMEEMLQKQEELWDAANRILKRMSAL